MRESTHSYVSIHRQATGLGCSGAVGWGWVGPSSEGSLAFPLCFSPAQTSEHRITSQSEEPKLPPLFRSVLTAGPREPPRAAALTPEVATASV